MKHAYENINLHSKTLAVIKNVNSIIEEYQSAGYTLTIRQIFYQFVARNLLLNNKDGYDTVADAVRKGRLNGLIDWDMVEDRSRTHQENSHWTSVKEILNSCAEIYALDSRITQNVYVEVWIEKSALLNLIAPVCEELDILYLSTSGNFSVSSIWLASQRLLKEDRDCVILHLADHDPEGVDMTRVIKDRLKQFCGRTICVKRVGLTKAQARKYNLPANSVKLTSKLAPAYIKKYGKKCYELDALPPEVIEDLIRLEVGKLTDEPKRQKQIALQEKHRRKLYRIIR